jgi:hypothetical protein
MLVVVSSSDNLNVVYAGGSASENISRFAYPMGTDNHLALKRIVQEESIGRFGIFILCLRNIF